MLRGCIIQAKPPMCVIQAHSDRISPCCTAPAPAETFAEVQWQYSSKSCQRTVQWSGKCRCQLKKKKNPSIKIRTGLLRSDHSRVFRFFKSLQCVSECNRQRVYLSNLSRRGLPRQYLFSAPFSHSSGTFWQRSMGTWENTATRPLRTRNLFDTLEHRHMRLEYHPHLVCPELSIYFTLFYLVWGSDILK